MDYEPKFGSVSDLLAIMVIVVIGTLIGLLMGALGVYGWINHGALDDVDGSVRTVHSVR
jgi:hypothetical protein